ALAVGVAREIDGLVLARRLADLGDDLLLALDDLVDRLEAVLHVDADLRLRQIAHVADRGLHDEARAEVLADRLGLRRRLDHDERGARLDLLRLLWRRTIAVEQRVDLGLLLGEILCLGRLRRRLARLRGLHRDLAGLGRLRGGLRRWLRLRLGLGRGLD